MSVSRKQEARALSADERDLVEKSHHPALQNLSDRELSELVKLLRERRDRASTQAQQRRREMRGKADARGAAPSRDDTGSRLKVSALAMAVRRLNSEAERRRRMSAKLDLAESAQRALALKEANVEEGEQFNSRRAHAGMRDIARTKRESLIRPMERGRLRKAFAVAQAKRDNRPAG